MKTLHRYLLGRVLAALVVSTAVLTFVLLLGNTLKQILELLMSGALALDTLVRVLGLLLPFVLMYALPMAMLTSVLLVFGRFSADNELTAARASGVSLVALVWPVLVLGLLLSVLCGLVSTEFGPRARAKYRQIIAESRWKMAGAFLPERRFVTELPGLIVYVGRNDGRHLKDVLLYFVESRTNVFAKIRAPTGEYFLSNGVLTLRLSAARGVFFANEQWYPGYFGEWTWQTNVTSTDKPLSGPGLRHMTARQLIHQIRALALIQAGQAPASTQITATEKQKTNIDLTLPARVQLQRQVAFAFASFAFTLVGIPLGVRLHRRETNVSVAVAIVIVLVYYTLMMVGESLDSRPEFHPQLLIWLPNLLLEGLGAWLLFKTNRG